MGIPTVIVEVIISDCVFSNSFQFCVSPGQCFLLEVQHADNMKKRELGT